MTIEYLNQVVKEAAEAANKVVSSANKHNVHLENLHSVNNALKVYKQEFPKAEQNADTMLWFDTFAYNLPKGLMFYIKQIYNNSEVYETGRLK